MISILLFLVSFIPYQHRELLNSLDTKTGDKQNQESIISQLGRLEGIDIRIHDDVQQLLERSNSETNQTSRIIDIVPHDFP